MTNTVPDNAAFRAVGNPFRGGVVGDPWNGGEARSDALEIHQDVFNICVQAIEEARAARAGDSGLGIIVHGAPGSGKTHLIGRLRRRLIDTHATPSFQRLSQAFAYVRLNTNASTLAQHIRRCVASDLLRTNGGGPSQLERLVVSQLMRADQGDGDLRMWWEYFMEVRRDDLDDLLASVQSSENLSPDFARVLGCLIRRQHRLDVAAWLRGDELSEAALANLGVGSVPEQDDPEETSRRMLIDFMRLAGPQVPLVLCFDQVEALQTRPDDTDSFFLFGKVVADLADADPNLVLISCLQTSRYQLLAEAVPGYAQDRMRGRASIVLNPLNREQAKTLLARRLEAAGLAAQRPDGAPHIWPLTDDDVAAIVGKVDVLPRRLLEAAAEIFEDWRDGKRLPKITLPDWLEQQWDGRMEQAGRLEAPAKEILTHAVPLLLRVVEPDWKAASAKQNVAVDHILAAPGNEARVGVKICEGQPISLAAQLKTLAALYPGQTGLHKLVLLRDERNPISANAHRTRQHIATLEKNDAVLLSVGPETLATLEAMRLLISDSQSGDFAFHGETVSEDQILAWLRANLPNSVKELVEILTTQAASPVSKSVDSLQEWIRANRIASWATATAAISLSGSAADELLNHVRERTDLFRVLEGEPIVVFSARLGQSEVNDFCTAAASSCE